MPSRSEREAKKKKREKSSNSRPKLEAVEPVTISALSVLPQDNSKTEFAIPTSNSLRRQIIGKQVSWFLAAVIAIVSLVVGAFQLAGVITMEIAHWLIFFAAVVAMAYISIIVFTSDFLKLIERKIIAILIGLVVVISFFYFVDLLMINKRAEIDKKAEQDRIASQPTPVMKPEDKKLVTEFVGKVEWHAVGTVVGKKYTAITYLIEIKNLGMQGAAEDWRLNVSLKGEQPFDVKPQPVIKDLELKRDGKNTKVIPVNEFISEKLKPIETGEIVRGYLHFFINKERSEVGVPGTIMKIKFKDVTGKQYFILDENFPPMNDDYVIPYTPGVQFKEKPPRQVAQK